MIHRALDAGINFVDTADVYGQGETEEIVGTALKGRRDEVVLATKVNGPMGEDPNRRGSSRRWIVTAVEDSLRRLRTDHIDLYQIHHPDPQTDIEETLSALTDLVRAGKVRAIGTSNLPAAEIVEAQWVADQRGLQRFRTEQPTYSILNRGIEREILPTCHRYGMGVLVWGPLAWDCSPAATAEASRCTTPRRMRWVPGHLTDERKLDAVEALHPIGRGGRSLPTHLAMAFAITHPGITSAVIGPRTMAQLDDLLAGAAVTLDDEVLDRIDRIVAPGTDIGPLDVAYMPPAVEFAALRRRPAAERRSGAMTVLTNRALNRATLARQLLLDRADLAVPEAIEHLCGLQAQEPQEPFVGLWSRVTCLRSGGPRRPADHSARRADPSHAPHGPSRHRRRRPGLAGPPRRYAAPTGTGVYRRELDGVDLDELAAAGRAVLADGRPHTMPELGRALAPAGRPTAPGIGRDRHRRSRSDRAAAAARTVAPEVGSAHCATRLVAGPRNRPACRGRLRSGRRNAGDAVSRRVRAGRGGRSPSLVRSGRAARRGGRDREELVAFRDERGRELLDLPDAPRPDPDTPAPVRFLPAFDNAILGYHDRSRIIDAPHRGLSVAGERVVLVDGRVTATWTVRNHQLRISPLRPLTALEQEAVHAEAQDLTNFLDEDIEHIQLDTEN